MLYLENKPLPANTQALLAKYQQAVNDLPGFPEKVAAGKKLFAQYNKKNNAAFKVVRERLADMSGGTIRCNYCEDSHANQVEHIYPKNFFPEKCFIWKNYCYACGPCNQPKSDHFAIYDEAHATETRLKDLPKNTPPPGGVALLIYPRVEQPLNYLYLDTQDTFKFVPLTDEGLAARKARYTIELLGLNARSYLVRARKNAFFNFRARLREYVGKKTADAPPHELEPLVASLRSEHHQTVWSEMIRQRSLHPELLALFHHAPEAMLWQ